MKKIYVVAMIMAFGTVINAQVVISQVYGGGGNGGATYTNDFVELFNRGTTAQNLNGWSIQYNSNAGTTWTIKTDLPNFNLQPGQYFLIQESSNAAVGISLPTPDLDGTVSGSTPAAGISMSASGGKVVLANSTTFVTGANPTDSQIVDKVGYGTSASGFEGTGPTGTGTSATLSAQRLNNGCTDTNNNPSDFATLAVAPRNSVTAINLCSTLSIKQNSISGLNISPNPAKDFLRITSDSNEVKQIIIYSVLGKEVLNTTVIDTPININALINGVYIVKVTEEGKTATRKLVVE
jgi:hypothetical protein